MSGTMDLEPLLEVAARLCGVLDACFRFCIWLDAPPESHDYTSNPAVHGRAPRVLDLEPLSGDIRPGGLDF